MKKLILIIIVFVSGCDLPQTTQTGATVQPKPYTRKIDDFIAAFKKNNPNMDLNDISCKEANDKFSDQTISFVKKEGNISDIPLTIQSMVEITKKKYLVHFHTDYSAKVQLDVFAYMRSDLAKGLSQSPQTVYCLVKYKNVKALNQGEAMTISTDRIYSYNIEICKPVLDDAIPIGNYSLDLSALKHN
jgi:hypothetical protein